MRLDVFGQVPQVEDLAVAKAQDMHLIQRDRRAIGAAGRLMEDHGGVLSLDNLETAMREGFDFVAMGRALIADPDLIARLQRGEATRSRCISCNKCVAEMDRGGVRCVLDAR